MSGNENQEGVTGKVIVFNPGGFILKVIFSIVVVLWGTKNSKNESWIDNIIVYAFLFLVGYLIATLFGFALNATHNYIVAVIVMGVLLFGVIALIGKVEDFMAGFGKVGRIVSQLLGIALLLLPLIRDIKKAIFYFKNTV